MATSSKAKIVLPPHTWYARGDDVTVIFPAKFWEGILAKRGTSPEERGSWFCEDLGTGEILALFSAEEKQGTEVEVDASDLAIEAITEFTAKYQNIHVIPYHTHPIDGPSPTDLEAYIAIYNETRGQIRDFLTIGPRE